MSTRRKVVDDEPQEQTYELPYHLKYRPDRWADVWGQDAVVGSLEASLKSKTRPHSFILTGPSGTGKTTLARIAAAELGVLPTNLMEIDAASNTGIDDMRAVLGPLRYKGFGDNPNKAIVVDEAHRLSKQAWDSLLKTVEEPPEHVFFFFCTTESGKIPKAIETRCAAYNLRPVKYEDIMDLLEYVAKKEKLDTPDRVLSLVAQSCDGSPRAALVMLAQVQDAKSEADAERILETSLEQKEVIDLARDLVQGKLTWEKLTSTLKAMPEQPAETIRIILVAYLTSCLMGSKTDNSTLRLLSMLDSFSRPYPPSDKLAPLLLSFGDHLFRN